MGIISDREQNFRHYLLARLLFVSVILVLALIFLAESPRERWPLLFLLVGNLALVGAAAMGFRIHRATKLVRWMTLSLGVALDTAVIYSTGGSVSEFVFLYFFSIGAASLFLGLWGSVWIAALSEAGYAFVLLRLQPDILVSLAFQLFLYGIYFFLTAVLTGFLAERLQIKDRELEDAQRELSQTRLDTQTILKSLGTGLLAVTQTGDVLYFNRTGRRILGIASDEIPSRGGEKDGVSAMHRFLDAVLTAEAANHPGEIEILMKDGTHRPIGFSVFPLRQEAGGERGKVILFQDLTRQKEEERERWRRERLAAIGKLARDLAHEIRNPLATISGCVEMLVEQSMGAAEKERFGELALRESQRLNRLLRDFSTFARLEVPRKKAVDFSDFLANRRGNGIPMDVQLPPELFVEADESQLSMVVDALLLALSLWAEEKDVVEIETLAHDADKVQVRFRLPQRVVPEDVLDSIFQPFGGDWKYHLGLALPTALRAVEGHGGQLRFFSRAGEGTGFELVLDSAKTDVQQKEAVSYGT
jgi:two-component system sensor histidine kinase PilS (NtrC family)